MSGLREQFEEAIKVNPRDYSLRKIYADWLDEFGEDKDAELAAKHRRWDAARQDAEEYLTKLAAFLANRYDCTPEQIADGDDYGCIDMTYEKLIAILRDNRDTNSWRNVFTLPYNTPDEVSSVDALAELWHSYELVTGETVNNKQQDVFSCSC